jgi:hypothetical protein
MSPGPAEYLVTTGQREKRLKNKGFLAAGGASPGPVTRCHQILPTQAEKVKKRVNTIGKEVTV